MYVPVNNHLDFLNLEECFSISTCLLLIEVTTTSQCWWLCKAHTWSELLLFIQHCLFMYTFFIYREYIYTDTHTQYTYIHTELKYINTRAYKCKQQTLTLSRPVCRMPLTVTFITMHVVQMTLWILFTIIHCL